MGLGRKALRTVKSMGKLSSLSSSSGLSQLESPVPQLLVSNYPPTDTQVYQINQAIAGAETLLLSLEYNGGRAKQCEACKEFIGAHKQTLSICRRIPPEIWQEVFLQLIPSDPQIILPIRYWIASTQVCRTWRVAGLSLPELWSFVPPVRLSNSRTEEPRFVASLHQFLSRSIPAPLRIRIDAPFREYTTPCSHLALDALVKHVERWEYLQIDTGYETYRRCFTSLGLEGRFASLRYLHIDVWRCYNSGERLLAFQNTPKLEEFSVHGVHPFAIDLPWNQLKVYTEKVENLGGLMTVLTRAKNLEKLEVTRVTAFLPDEFAELPILKTLYLRYDSVIPPDTVLLFLVAPKLEDLQIIGCEGEIIQNLMVLLSRAPGTKGRGPWPVPDFAKTRHRTLRRLAFRTKTMTPGNLAKLLRLLPYLEELDISQPPGQDVERLVIDPSGPSTAPLVPNLKKLYIHSDGNWGDEDIYRRLAQSRCEPQAALSQSEKGAKPQCGTLGIVPDRLREPSPVLHPTSGSRGMVRSDEQRPDIPSTNFSEDHTDKRASRASGRVGSDALCRSGCTGSAGWWIGPGEAFE
ncbi:hypothetical protein DFP72DRAFT_540680 [Ephemerocybe angulata]|uniref:F-box domain-containing protein n=1 Tax=Ephemerocybe angulata TaxID=980116 RepID=A0A8H6M2A0_9AGAR|nr:hypothetical protein DFP72DRAFT_540680 [Tulosesus angulatus]